MRRPAAARVTVDQAATLVERIVESSTFGDERIAPLKPYIHAGRDPSLRDDALIAGLPLRRLAIGTPGPTTVADALRLLVTPAEPPGSPASAR